MSTYTEYFLKSKSTVVQLETLEITHPSWTTPIRVVRNATNGITVTLETSVSATFNYCPLKLEQGQAKGSLDSSITVTIGDLGETVRTALNTILSAGTLSTYPTVRYRVYRSDDLTAPMYGPIVLQLTSFAFNREGASFEAKAPILSIAKTGEVYTLDRFPGLRGFL